VENHDEARLCATTIDTSHVDEIEFLDGKKIVLPAKGRLANLGNATGSSPFVMSASFTHQPLAPGPIGAPAPAMLVPPTPTMLPPCLSGRSRLAHARRRLR
jgi:hypothetical protein